MIFPFIISMSVDFLLGEFVKMPQISHSEVKDLFHTQAVSTVEKMATDCRNNHKKLQCKYNSQVL